MTKKKTTRKQKVSPRVTNARKPPTRNPTKAASARAKPAAKPDKPKTAAGKRRTDDGAARKSRAAPAPEPEARKPVKSPYSKAELRPMRQSLVDRRTRLLADLNLMSDEALRAADPEVDSDDVADHGTDAYERNLTLGLMEQDAATLRRIEEAFQAMDEGVYGLCSECSEPIPLPRLQALPFATTCVPCQELKEEGGFE